MRLPISGCSCPSVAALSGGTASPTSLGSRPATILILFPCWPAGTCDRALSQNTTQWQPRADSFNHLSGERAQRKRDRNPERLRGLEVDDQVELSRLLHRQLSRLLTLEDTPGVGADQAVLVGDAAPIAHQRAGSGKLAKLINRRHPMPKRQCGKLFNRCVEQWIGANHQSGGTQSHRGRESSVQLGFAAGVHGLQLQSKLSGRGCDLVCLNLGIAALRIDQGGYDPCAW